MRYAGWYFVFIFSISNARAQVFPDIRFSHLTERDGLSNNQVNWIEQDHEGFIWFATQDGLDRFDGYKISTFYHIAGDKNSLVNNLLSRLYCDNQDHIWISTQEGLSRYDKRTGLFNNFQHNDADSNSLSYDQYNGIYIDHHNNAWVTTNNSLYCFDSSLHYKKEDIQFKRLKFDKQPVDMYNCIVADRQGQLWASTLGTVFLLDSTTMRVKNQFTHFSGNVTAIYQDTHLQYWIGAFGGGLQRFDPATGDVEPVPLTNAAYVVNSITEWTDQNNSRWIVLGTDIGLVLVDPVSLRNKMYKFEPEYFLQNFLSGNSISRVFVDRQNILWIATDEGVSYVEPYKQLFEEWGDYHDSSGYGISDNIYAVSRNDLGLWMTKWRGCSLDFIDKAGVLEKKITAVHIGNRTVSLAHWLKPYDVKCEGNDILWFTTSQYLIRYDLSVNRAEAFRPPDASNFTGLRTIVARDANTWLIRTRNNGSNGIYVFDPAARKFTGHYRDIPGCRNCPPPLPLDLFVSTRKASYVSSRTEGLYKYDSVVDNFVPFFKFEGDEVGTHSNGFECIDEDKAGVLWIGTFKGLFALDPLSKKIVHDYSDDPFIGGLDILNICFDEQQNLWMNTDRGIFCLIPASGQIRQFNRSDGLPDNAADNILVMFGDHYMYSSLKNFLVRFRPDKLLQTPPHFSDVRFSEATVMDKPYSFRYNSSGNKLMDVEPGENRFTLDFSVLNYDVTDNNQFYYRLDGLMNDWQQNRNGHLAFFNLSPGKYDLHVRGANKYGSLPGLEDIVTISVKPHWWQTLWFRAIYISALVCVAIILISKRISNIRRQASYKQKLTEMEMMAMRAQMNPHFIFNSLNSIENFIMQNKKRQASDYLNKFARLIRMILENSREDVVTIAKDMDALQLYVDLEQLRFNNKFSYETSIDGELLDDNYRVSPLLIQPFVENAIVHGLANSDKSNLFLHVVVQLDGDNIKYIIEDNGVGRKQAAWYKAQNRPNHKSIGMQITRERINLFNQQQHEHDAFTINDLYDENNRPAGTRVEIKIKPV